MSPYATFSSIIVLSALFAYVNHRYLKLPSAIGLMLLGLVTSLLLLILGAFRASPLEEMTSFLNSFDFSELLLGSLLSFMLFAGGIQVNLADLHNVQWSVVLFSTLSVLISTAMIGTVMFVLLPLFGIAAPLVECLLFGALISPTDPIAVLAILRLANLPKDLSAMIEGESLFNDGVAIVLFLVLLEATRNPGAMHVSGIVVLFFREAIGGLFLGLTLGYLGFRMLRSIDNYKVEVLVTLAVVMGGYSLASALHVSGPLAMVAAGILIGNPGRALAMSERTAKQVETFWEMIDEILNSVLFVLIGLEMLSLHFDAKFLIIGAIAILLALIARLVSVYLPSRLTPFGKQFTWRTMRILTWGGLRGGISIALALSLPKGEHAELWVTTTYIVAAFTILVQGLTVKKVAGSNMNLPASPSV